MISVAMLLLAQLHPVGPPIARIGAVDGDTSQILHQVARVKEDRSGRVFVLQNGAPYVAVFDSLGRRIGTLGRAGGGPGEFGYPATVSVIDDTVYVADHALGKFSLFDSELRHVRDLTLGSMFPALGRLGSIRPLARLGDGTYLVAAVEERSTTYVVQPDGSYDEILTVPVGDYTARVQVGDRRSYITKPITETPIVAAAGGRAYVFTHTEPGGILLRDVQRNRFVRVSIPRRRVTDAHISAAIEAFVERSISSGSGVSQREVERAFTNAIDAPEHSYFLRGVVEDVGGELWLLQEAPGERGSVLYEVDPETGIVLQTLELGPGLRVFSVRGNAAWVLEKDSNDVPYLLRYRLGS